MSRLRRARRSWVRWLLAVATVALFAGDAAAEFRPTPPSVPPGAVGEGAYDGNEATVEARLLIDGEAAAAGQPIRMGVLFAMDPGWHIYWRNSGESGVPTQMNWQVEHATLGDVAWPAPAVFSESDGLITTYGYEGEVLLARDVVFDPSTRGKVAVNVDVGFIVCKIGCIPGEISLRRSIEVASDAAPPADAAVTALFDAEAARVPVAAESLGVSFDVVYSQSAIRPSDAFKAAIAVISCASDEAGCEPLSPRPTPATGPHHGSWTFVPDAPESIDVKVEGTRPHPFYPHAALILLSGEAWSGDPAGDQRLRGVVALKDASQQVHFVEVDVPLPRAAAGAEVALIDNPFLEPDAEVAAVVPAAAAEAPALPDVSLALALLLAFLGGIVLNAMPCVLPVLAIKMFAVAGLAQRSRRELLGHGAAYTAGIVISLLALAAVVASLRAAGAAVGWGFQFQEPLFVAVVSAVLVIFALNLFGVFEIGFDPGRLGQVGRDAHGVRRSFFEGLLAVVLATPCSAPFLGTAIGFAFASPAPVIFAIFAAIGLGLAAPYAVVTLVPGFGRLMPKPGAWMIAFRKVLGGALLATVVWLLWIAGRVGGDDGFTFLLVFLAAVACVTWLAGHFQKLGRNGLARRVAAASIVLGVAALWAAPVERTATAAEATATAASAAAAPGAVARDDERWQVFDRTVVEAAVASGRPVFVTFTADWCITCKLNEHAVLSDERVTGAFDALDVETYKADWTRRDEAIRRELARFGRAGVPMYLVYRPGSPADPEVLPELLTVDTVLEALRAATGPAQAARGDGSVAKAAPGA